MRKLLLAVLLLALVGCTAMPVNRSPIGNEVRLSPYVTRFVDREAGVVCWIYDGVEEGGIFCLPLSQTRLDVGGAP